MIPSIDHRQGSICIVDLDREEAIADALTNELPANLSRNPISKNSGIDEAEHRTTIATETSQAALPNINDITGSARPDKRPLDCPSERSQKGPSSQSACSSTVSLARSAEEFIPDVALQHFLKLLEHTNLARDPRSQEGKITGSRQALLRDALKASDCTYLVLHQIYCLYSQSQKIVWDTCADFRITHSVGLKKLSYLLMDNSVMDAEATKWFSTFPLPIEILLQRYASCRIAYTNVLGFLEKFDQHWLRMQEESRMRNCPPSPSEMTLQLGLDSVVLQGVLYRAVHRNIWSGDCDQCYQSGEAAFFRAQRNIREQRDAGLIERQNKAFIHDFQQLRLRHTTYCAAPKRLKRNHENAHRLQMAPPQNRHSTMPSNGASNASRSVTASVPRLNINTSITSDQQNSARPRTAYTPTLPPSSAPSSPKPLQGDLPHSFVPHPCRTLSSNPQATVGPHGSTVGQPIQTPPAPEVLQRGCQGFPMQGVSPAASSSLSGQQVPRTIMQSFARPRSSLPSPPSGGPVPFPRQPSHVTTSSPNQFPPSSSIMTSSSFPVQASHPQFSGDRNINGNIVYGHNPLYAPPSNSLAAAPSAPSIFIRAGENFPQAISAVSSIHQAHLRSPILGVTGLEGEPDGNTKWFTYIKDVVILPERLHSHKRFVTWDWNESKEEVERLAVCTLMQDGSPMQMKVRVGTRISRIRCVRFSDRNNNLTESAWVTTDHAWPDGIAVILNGKALGIKKKLHHGKDVPVNITPNITEGSNTLSIGISQLQPGDNSVYAFGLEDISLTNTSIIKSEIKTLDILEARERIRKTASQGDSDVQVLDPTITLDLSDPYSSYLCHTPARSTLCRHNQCFDLDIFLSTRSSKAPTEPCSPEVFRCPLCNQDARPKTLYIDGFLVKVREELEKLQRLDVKFILLDEAGRWSIKEAETSGETGDGTGKRKSASVGPHAGQKSAASEVIELDDGD